MDFVSSYIVGQHIDQLQREASQSRLVAAARKVRRTRKPGSAGGRHASYVSIAE